MRKKCERYKIFFRTKIKVLKEVRNNDDWFTISVENWHEDDDVEKSVWNKNFMIYNANNK